MAENLDTYCLVTGATGVIGRPVVRHLLERGRKVLSVGQRPCPFPDHPNLSYIPLDLHDEAAVSAFFDRYKPRHLIHLAWEATPGKFWHARENVDWVSSSAHLLDKFICAGGEKAVLAGSCAEYGWTDAPLDEAASAVSPKTLYSASKNAFRQMAEVIAQDIDLVWARIFFPYGPGEDTKKLISHIIDEISHDRIPEFQNPGRAVDFIHLEDVGEALALLAYDRYSGVVNICTGRSYRPAEIALTYARLMQKDPSICAALEKAVANTPEESSIRGNPEIINQLLTNRPTRSLEEGLQTYIHPIQTG